MVDKNIRLKTKNEAGGFDNLYPQTKSDLVLVNEKNLSTVLAETATQSAQTDNRLKSHTPLTNTGEAYSWQSAYESRKAYDEVENFAEHWNDLEMWSRSTFGQIQGGRLYGAVTPQGGESGASHTINLGENENLRLVFNVRTVDEALGGVIIGVSTDIDRFATGGANTRGLYFHQDNIKPFTKGVSGTVFEYLSGTRDWIVTLTADESWVTITAVDLNTQKEYSYKWVRDFIIGSISIFNSDTRALTGHSIGAIGARKSTVTNKDRSEIEDVGKTVHWTQKGTTKLRIALPKNYDSRRPSPVVMLFHGNGSNEKHWVESPNGMAVEKAFVSNGYIALSATAPNTTSWGSQASLDAYFEAYEYLREHYAIGKVVLYGNSMGGIESLLTLAEGRIGGIVAWVGSVPTTNLSANYANNLFTGSINTAYGINSDGSNYNEKTSGHDPSLKEGYKFRGIPMYALVATDDVIVKANENWQLFEPIVKPFATELVTVNVNGGHSTGEIANHANKMLEFASKYAK